MPETYMNDAPLTEEKDDRFRRWAFAQRIAETIATRVDTSSIVIAIYGAWGDGKTTVLNYVEKAFEGHKVVIPLRYNPWRFGSEDELLVGFFESLARKLDSELETKKEKLLQTLQRHSAWFTFFPKFGSAVASVAEKCRGPGLDKLRERIENLLEQNNRRVCILIDDIDRLERAEIYAVFRLVKLTADFANISYILAFDRDLVAASLGERYGAGDKVAGAAFLEKIVQVPLDLPPAGQDSLVECCNGCIDEALRIARVELTSDEAQDIAFRIVRFFQAPLKTPRLCKRFGNALSFALPILRGEVNTVDHITVEGLRVFYPRIYGVLRDNKDEIFCPGTDRRFEQQKKWIESALLPILGEHSPEEASRIKKLLCELLPVIAHVLGGSSYGEGFAERWRRERRVTASEYFDRYFRYAIPAGDISDREIDGLITAAATKSTSDVAGQIDKLISDHTAKPVIQKLRAMDGQLAPDVSVRLAQAVSRIGPKLPRPESFLGLDSPFEQAAILIGNLLRKVADRAQRRSLIEGLIKESTSIGWALRLWQWCRDFESEPGYDKELGDADDKAYGALLAASIEQQATKAGADFIEGLGRDLSGALSIWNHHGDPQRFRRYWKEAFERDPAEAARLLVSYNPKARAIDTGKRRRGHFAREQYNSVVGVLDPELVIGALKKVYGGSLDSPKDEHEGFADDCEYVAHQFCRIHAIVKASETETP